MEEMRNIDNVMVVGDVHGNWEALNYVIAEQRPDVILACGDFGVWPNFPRYSMERIKNKNTKIYFCDGNHEDHDFLDHFVNKVNGGDHSKPHELYKNIFYCPRGSTLELKDGRTVLFMGGAYSIDKYRRTPGYDWFHQETLKPKDLEHLPDKKIDILISHTCCKSNLQHILDRNPLKGLDVSYEVLERVIEKYSPTLWYFGHWHHYKRGWTNMTNWTCLSASGSSGFWVWLDDGAKKHD